MAEQEEITKLLEELKKQFNNIVLLASHQKAFLELKTQQLSDSLNKISTEAMMQKGIIESKLKQFENKPQCSEKTVEKSKNEPDGRRPDRTLRRWYQVNSDADESDGICNSPYCRTLRRHTQQECCSEIYDQQISD